MFAFVGYTAGFFAGLALWKAQHYERRDLLLAWAAIVPFGALGGFAGAAIGLGVYEASHRHALTAR